MTMTRNHFLFSPAVAAAILWAASVTPATAQNKTPQKSSDAKYNPPALHKGQSAPAPRTPDGHVDFSGMWIEKYQALGADTVSGDPQARVDTDGAPKYPSDALPYQPWAATKARQLFDSGKADPLIHCEPYGVPRIWGGPHPARMIQLPGELVILYERDTAYRVIPTDGRPHPKDADPSWMGNSVANWQGDTLVVDTTDLIDKSWLGTGKNAGEGSGTFHSDALHVIEKIRRPDHDHLAIEITNEDSKVFTKPWVFTWNMNLVPDEEFYEDVTCSNEQDLEHVVPNQPTSK
jgi:hypothetical protein